MIAPLYYAKSNWVRLFTKANHFLPKERVLATKVKEYVMKQGETLYDIARKIFGNNRENYWTIIAELNEPRMPDEWEAGEIILIPEVIIQESSFSTF